MIASIRGEIQAKETDSVVVEAGGVGYLLQVSRQTLQSIGGQGDECRLWTHFYVREDRQQLFGFAALAEREAFEILLTVKGVGPRLALAVLSELSPAGLRQALLSGQTAQLNKLPGVGKKLAERLAVELKDKVQSLALGEAGAAAPELLLEGNEAMAVAALQNLGFNRNQSRQAVQAACQNLGEAVSAQEIVRSALKLI
jgi:Holliday junction DNA helicase RuvA